MKKVVSIRTVVGIFICSMLLLLNCMSVFADVAWDPQDDFYKRHERDCQRCDLERIANGPDGRVIVWKSPVSAIEVDSIENGSKVYIEYFYTDKRGHEWGISYGGDKTGWIPMEYLVPEPGSRNFFEKHGDEIQKYSEQVDIPEEVEKVIFWEYPESGVIKYSWSVTEDDVLHIDTAYTDRDGRKWGYVNYFKQADGWVCLEDPSNEQIPVNEEDAADIKMPPVPDVTIVPQQEGPNVIVLVSVLVVVVAAITVILIRVSFNKNNGKSSKSD